MKKIFFILLFAGALKAETTWIPIANGDVTIIIPFIPRDIYQQPLNLNIADDVVSWQDVLHASNYLVQGLTSNDEWIDIVVTKNTTERFDNRFVGFGKIRVKACNYLTCDQTGHYATLNVVTKPTYRYKKYSYDALGRLVCEKDSEYGSVKYELDAAGNRKSVTQHTCE